MQKYLPITAVIVIFFLLVFIVHSFSRPTDILKPSSSSNNVNINPTTKSTTTNYRDGQYTGSVEDAFYGNIQVKAVVSNGKLVDVVPLQYPNDNPTSIAINSQALQILKSEAIQSQSSQVDMVTGASDTTPAFSRSLENALSQAK